MRIFLSFTEDGQQVFFEERGKCSGLMRGVPVYTHHASLMTKYTTDPTVCVEVHRLPIDTILSGPSLARMTYSAGDNAIRAHLGYLDEEDAPKHAELALMLAFKEGQLNTFSFLIGGEGSSQVVPLTKLEGLCKNVDCKESVTVAVDLAAILFEPGRKATPWKKIEIMFKDSLSGSIDFSNELVYARWRILESKPKEGDRQPLLALHLEVLPLRKKLEDVSAELKEKHNSNSNIAISLVSIPLKWRKPEERKILFTTPCLVRLDTKSVVTDGNVRLSMASVRDVLRRGRSSEGSEEHKATITAPQVVNAWERSARQLHMTEVDSYEVIEKGNYGFYLSYLAVFT